MNTRTVRSLALAALGLLATSAVSLSADDDAPGCQRAQVTTQEAEGTGDGGITAAKHSATAAKRFEMMDANHDGKISVDEIEASHGAESIVWANHPASSAQKLRSLDRNHDGVLTLAEYTIGSQRMFEELDVDGNGVLTPNEMMIR